MTAVRRRQVAADAALVAFEEHRPHLLRVGYRITGSFADAEDAVQEAWLRLHALDDDARAGLRDERAWLATVVGRVCLDRLRSAGARRERYVGPWLPEPLVTTAEDEGPLAAVVRDESVRMAAMVVLERLNPRQRVALVLHDALDLPFATIATVLGCSEAAARQHATRARRIVAEQTPPPVVRAEQEALLARFADAIARADLDALVAVLHPDAVFVNDSGGLVRAARREIVGADKVARLILGLMAKYGQAAMRAARPVLVNGELGLFIPGANGLAGSVTAVAVREGRIAGLHGVVNPEKLGTLRRSLGPGR
jgi:RNA polymerase sigma-70 factor, ECF subfamily